MSGETLATNRRELKSQRHALVEFARWIERHFYLNSRPGIATATEAEVIYAHALRRIAHLTNRIDELPSGSAEGASGDPTSDS